jgi:MerR family transcriptional regulator, copper efflux regulator
MSHELCDPASIGRSHFTIGEAARHSGVTAKMIRHYEAIGLIPKAGRTAGDYRVYSPEDLHRLRFIRRARGLGFSIAEINQLLGLWSNRRRASSTVKELALKHVAELDAKIGELNAIRATLADLARHCQGDERPDCPILDELGRVSKRVRKVQP